MRQKYLSLATYDTKTNLGELRNKIKGIPEDAQVRVSQGKVWLEWLEKPPFEVLLDHAGLFYISNHRTKAVLAKGITQGKTAHDICEFLNSQEP